MQGIKVDFITNTIIITKEFAALALIIPALFEPPVPSSSGSTIW